MINQSIHFVWKGNFVPSRLSSSSLSLDSPLLSWSLLSLLSFSGCRCCNIETSHKKATAATFLTITKKLVGINVFYLVLILEKKLSDIIICYLQRFIESLKKFYQLLSIYLFFFVTSPIGISPFLCLRKLRDISTIDRFLMWYGVALFVFDLRQFP